MVIQNLQDKLVKEIQDIFTNETLLNEQEEFSKVKVFSQYLPVRPNREDIDLNEFPYIIVNVIEGEVEVNKPYLVRIYLDLGVHDPSPERQGHKDLLHIINLLYEKLSKTNSIGGEFYLCDDYMHWHLLNEETYPFYYGGFEFYVYLPKYERIDEFL